MYEFLKMVPLFADLPEADLAQLCEQVEDLLLPAGEVLFTEGSPGDRAYVIQSGALEIVKTTNNRELLLAVRESGEVIGEIALLEETPRMASVRARVDTRLLAIGKEQLEQLLNTSPSAAQAMLHTILSRWRSTEAKLRQREKMAQLGTLTAGVAHELNNPAAAVRSGADQMKQTLEQFAAAYAAMSQLPLSPTQRESLQALAEQAQAVAEQPSIMSALERSDLESELESWLEEQGIEDGWELAPDLVNLSLDEESLRRLVESFSPPELHTVLAWLSSSYATYHTLAEIKQGAQRVSGIVKALKSYAYLDQAPIQSVDLHQGLNETLLILQSKLGGVTVRRDYAPNLPKIEGYGGELNQVWTNMIDNAADALEGSGELTIHTEQRDEWVMVEIIDNGPGIPPAIQPRLFDPFFTTKPPGKGTGLGLDISYNIVVNKHRGDIKVFSQPGRTVFQVWLPVNFENAQGAAPTLVASVRADDATARRILESIHTIAVVGISHRHESPAYSVPAYMQAAGYRIIPVNPTVSGELLGEKVYPDLLSIAEPVDVVEIFRGSEMVVPIVEQAIQIGAKVIWMQEGIINEQAAALARNAGLEVVMDTCMRVMHRRLVATKNR